jgi:hypothetical protein
MAEADPVILTVVTGLTSGGANQRDYNYVGSFAGGSTPENIARFPGGAPAAKSASYATGVTAPWARLPIKFKV